MTSNNEEVYTQEDEGDSLVSLFGDRRRRLVRENTRETRSNWFVAFDPEVEARLLRQMPVIPGLPPAPEEDRSFDVPFVVVQLIVSLFIAAIAVASFFVEPVLWLDLLVLIVVGSWLSKLPSARRATVLWGLNRWDLAMVCGSLVFALVSQAGERFLSVIGALLQIGAAYLMLYKGALKWKTTKDEVKSHNGRVSNAREVYDRATAARERVFAERASIQSQIDGLAVSCLHYDEMARIRRELIDSVLERAFAELGVSDQDQRLVMADRDRLILEIAGPTVGFGGSTSSFDRPIIEFPFQLRSFGPNDSPALRRYLSHLYLCKIGLVLPQGLGIYEAIVDSVDLSVSTRGHELLLWKSISRVTRMNTDDSVESDTVSIQSYGGSETILPVNGFFVGENNESVTVVSLELPDGEADSGVTQNRVVNSFVLSIQQKMTG